MKLSLARRERRQIACLFAAPLLIFVSLFVRQMRAAPLFPVPASAQVLESHWSPLSRFGGSAYVQRVQSPLSPAQFWAQTMPLLKMKNMNPDEFHAFPDTNQADVRDHQQQTFRYFGLTPLPTPKNGCSFSGGNINHAQYNVYLWPYKSGTIAEFWLREPLK
jgi:hypothetical protein